MNQHKEQRTQRNTVIKHERQQPGQTETASFVLLVTEAEDRADDGQQSAEDHQDSRQLAPAGQVQRRQFSFSLRIHFNLGAHASRVFCEASRRADRLTIFSEQLVATMFSARRRKLHAGRVRYHISNRCRLPCSFCQHGGFLRRQLVRRSQPAQLQRAQIRDDRAAVLGRQQRAGGTHQTFAIADGVENLTVGHFDDALVVQVRDCGHDSNLFSDAIAVTGATMTWRAINIKTFAPALNQRYVHDQWICLHKIGRADDAASVHGRILEAINRAAGRLNRLAPMLLSQTEWAQNSRFIHPIMEAVRPGEPWYEALYMLGIIFFAYFYISIVMKPDDIADNFRKSGSFIPGIRPGKRTSDFINDILTRITLVGALYLIIISLVPTLMISGIRLDHLFLVGRFFERLATWTTAGMGVNFYFGGTSLLIVVGVAMDTVNQIESQLIMRHYDGFSPRSGRIRGRKTW